MCPLRKLLLHMDTELPVVGACSCGSCRKLLLHMHVIDLTGRREEEGPLIRGLGGGVAVIGEGRIPQGIERTMQGLDGFHAALTGGVACAVDW